MPNPPDPATAARRAAGEPPPEHPSGAASSAAAASGAAPSETRQIVEADLTWTGEAFAAGIQVAVATSGRIAEVGPLGREPTRRLAARALLPGFVDAHSHAFQRGLRGRGESFPAGAGSFWSWREAMYRLAGSLDGDGFEALCRQAFGEMRRAGITAVGEFHYLRHQREGDFALDERLLAAARAAGIRLVLLLASYQTGGIGRPLEGAQRRFATPSPDAYWRQIDRLGGLLDASRQSLGAAAHSLRAVPPEEVAALAAEARRRGLVFHLHLEEQRREVEDCLAAYGVRPMEILLDRVEVGAGVTAVHCTHTAPADLERFARAGGLACLCPTTEANLGDGLAQGLPRLAAAGGSLCLGTDSNARISMLEEMRWLEYGQRLAREERGVLRDARGEVAGGLLRAATLGGARALGLPAGEIAPGFWADLVALDLHAPSLSGTDAASLPAALAFGCGEEVVASTCVGGKWEDHR